MKHLNCLDAGHDRQKRSHLMQNLDSINKRRPYTPNIGKQHNHPLNLNANPIAHEKRKSFFPLNVGIANEMQANDKEVQVLPKMQISNMQYARYIKENTPSPT